MRAGKDPSTLRPTDFEVNPVINEKIVLWRGDITALKIGGIVNAANSDLWAGGGICGAIHKAAGSNLQRECKKIGFCPTGSTVITQGYKLPSEFVLHSVGPTNRSPLALQSCYQTIMELCVEKKVRSVCMCCISTGIFGFPNGPACLIALETVRKFLEVPENQAAIDLVVFCTFLIEDVQLYDEFTPVFFPVERLEEPQPSMYCGSFSCWQQNACALHVDPEAGEQKAVAKRSSPSDVSPQDDSKDSPKEPELKSPKIKADSEAVSLSSLQVSTTEDIPKQPSSADSSTAQAESMDVAVTQPENASEGQTLPTESSSL